MGFSEELPNLVMLFHQVKFPRDSIRPNLRSHPPLLSTLLTGIHTFGTVRDISGVALWVSGSLGSPIGHQFEPFVAYFWGQLSENTKICRADKIPASS